MTLEEIFENQIADIKKPTGSKFYQFDLIENNNSISHISVMKLDEDTFKYYEFSHFLYDMRIWPIFRRKTINAEKLLTDLLNEELEKLGVKPINIWTEENVLKFKEKYDTTK